MWPEKVGSCFLNDSEYLFNDIQTFESSNALTVGLLNHRVILKFLEKIFNSRLRATVFNRKILSVSRDFHVETCGIKNNNNFKTVAFDV